jgi:hypothetical protein
METVLIISSDKIQFSALMNEKLKEIGEQGFQVLDIKYQMCEIDLRPRHSGLVMFAHKDEIKNMVKTTKY